MSQCNTEMKSKSKKMYNLIIPFFQKQANLPDQEVPKADTHKDDQPQTSDAQFVHFEQFTTLPAGLRKYVAKDLIGTPLEDIDPFYKDKQASEFVEREREKETESG